MPSWINALMNGSSIIVVTPPHLCDPALAVAAVRAGEIGLLDLGFGSDDATRRAMVERLASFAAGKETWGIRWDTLGSPDRTPALLADDARSHFPYLLVAGLDDETALKAALYVGRTIASRVFAEAYDVDGARDAARIGFDGIVLKANEAGGRVSPTSAFVLLQQIANDVGKPYWVQGAWGPDTASAANLAGAAGIVLGEELWLARESPISDDDKTRLGRLDGSETTCLGGSRVQVRVFGRLDETFADEDAGAQALCDRWWRARGDGKPTGPIPLGQGVAFAARLAGRHVTVGGILQAFRKASDHNPLTAPCQKALAPESPLATDVSTRFPIFQGPMTRVSDLAPFCKSVADNGALSFLALALMRGPEVRELLGETKRLLGDRPWGIGILGFVPPELRNEQLEAVREFGPRFAVIAGGRPSQAKAMEDEGISTYLHVPSPGLLETFLEQGARKFIFEGRECGGHVGPRSSFTLWQSAIDVLLDAPIKDPKNVHVLYAGGIHGALSSAMIQTLAVPLVERGMKIGVLMGTAYLFTQEAVDCGAISAVYQEEAVDCRETVLLESGVGHATRCVRSPFAEEFENRKSALVSEGRSGDEARFELEMLNMGRLRLASKGLKRKAAKNAARGVTIPKGKLATVGPAVQRREGLFMIGEVARLRRETVTMAELHEDVCVRGTEATERFAESRRPKPDERRKPPQREPIAVIGMACLFPQSPDLRSYWQNILNGFSAVREVPAKRWNSELFYSPDRLARDMLYSKWGCFLDEVRFNPVDYGIPPAAVTSIDPMQLMLLQVCERALGDAGYDKRPFRRDRTAVIVGAGGVNDIAIDYAFRTMIPHYLARLDDMDDKTRQAITDDLRAKLPRWTEDTFPGLLGNVLSGRVANRLDLKGPNFVVDAACAASLAATYTAVGQLRSGACDMALLGAADGTNHAFTYMCFARTHALTPSGTVRPFDDRADGIVMGEGIAAVVLKRLADAERDGDRIYAVIRGVGSSSDGRNRSLTAPHDASQALAIRRALEDAAVEPSAVSLFEAHATGTAVGDKSEIAAMKDVFGASGWKEPFCAVGSVKSMIGHAKAAAGLASLVKTVLAVHHKVLPPTNNVEIPNKRAGFEDSPFFVNSETRPWFTGDDDEPRRAGVSAFGFGGTNFHVLLEEYRGDYLEDVALDLTPRPAELFFWSRDSHERLGADLDVLHSQLTGQSDLDLAQLARSIHSAERTAGSPGPGESVFDSHKPGSRRVDEQTEDAGAPIAEGQVRLGIVATSVDDLIGKLDRARRAAANGEELHEASGLYLSAAPAADPKQVCFLFPGQGAQRPGMLKDLVQYGPFGRELFEDADRLLADELPRTLSSYIFPRPVFDKESTKRIRSDIDDTRIAQPALGVVDLFACDVLSRFGITPAVTAGHSYGEYVALCVAGLWSRPDLMRLSALRGKMVHEAARDHPGGMAAVAASEEETQAAIDELKIDVLVANVNAPNQTIVAGPLDAIDDAIKRLPSRKLAVRRVPVSAAFHTPAMEAPSRALGQYLEATKTAPLRIPVYSNVSAEPYPSDAGSIHEQILIHFARRVRFADQIRAMYRDGMRVFLEVGPGRILTGLVERILADQPHTAIALDQPGQPSWSPLAHLLARTFSVGLRVDLAPWFERRGLQDVPLDVYLTECRRRSEPQPTEQRLSPEGSRPAQSEQQTRAAQAPASRSGPKQAEQVAPSMSETPTGRADVEPIVAHLQDAMNKWLDLQKEQQRLSERFLDMQERVIDSFLGGSTDTRRRMADSLERGRRTAEHDRSLDSSLPVAPAPLLPSDRPTLKLPEIDPELYESPDGDFSAAVSSDVPTVNEPVDAGTSGAADEELPSAECFQQDLLAEVSRRTGYPEDMLDLDEQLEAGLGIDSIKTMEIFSALRKYHRILTDEEQDEEELLVQLTQMKTLRTIVEHYSARREQLVTGTASAKLDDEQETEPAPPRPTVDDEEEEEITPCATVERLVLRPVPAVVTGKGADVGNLDHLPTDEIILILGDPPELASSMQAALRAGGHRVVQLIPGRETREMGLQRYGVDLSDPKAIRELVDQVRGPENARIAALINLLPLTPPMSQCGVNGHEPALELVQCLINVARTLEDDLRSDGEREPGWLINVTSLDGRFGLRSGRELPLAQAGSLGVCKSLAQEWQGVRVKNVDFDPETDSKTLMVRLIEEIATWDGNMEIGVDDQGRWKLELAEEPADSSEPAAGIVTSGLPLNLPLDAESVVLATGGACGITAELLKRLARETGNRLIVVGRSPLSRSEDEPSEIRDLEDEAELRTAMIRLVRTVDETANPAEIEQELQKILKQRAIRANLEELREAGSEVAYHAVDVRDSAAFAELIDDVYRRFGRLDGVLHGAGVTEDRMIRDKTPGSIARVFETKVKSALVLAKKLKPEDLRFLVLFSSVSGRFGNAGQTDYSAANEFLNKLADHLSRKWPGRVVSINWGPWDGGMVSEGLRNAYHQRGIRLIGNDAGYSSFMQELSLQVRDPEVVLACTPQAIAEARESLT